MSKLLITDPNFITDKQMYDALHEKYICFSAAGTLINKKTLKIVGKLQADGYITTSFNDKAIGVHRIIFCMIHGYMPKIIDHINRDRADNRIDNLREVSASGNMLNASISSKNTSGVKGVTWNKYDHRWKALICFDNKQIFIGNFKNFINAVKARYYAEQKLGYDEYELISSAKKYLMSTENFSFVTNIKIEKEEKDNKDSVENEWNFFILNKKQKIDDLLKRGILPGI